jgi:hypothetical protein
MMACTEKGEIWKISESVDRMEVGTATVCEANGSGFKEKSSEEDDLINYVHQPQPLNEEMISIAISKAAGSFARIRA